MGNGLTVAAGFAPATRGDTSPIAMLFVLDAGSKVASIVVLAPDADTVKASQQRIDG